MTTIVCERCGKKYDAANKNRKQCPECRRITNIEKTKSARIAKRQGSVEPKAVREAKAHRRAYIAEKVRILDDFGITKLNKDMLKKWQDLNVSEGEIDKECRKLIDKRLDSYIW